MIIFLMCIGLAVFGTVFAVIVSVLLFPDMWVQDDVPEFIRRFARGRL